jgi:hypothetical protein
MGFFNMCCPNRSVLKSGLVVPASAPPSLVLFLLDDEWFLLAPLDKFKVVGVLLDLAAAWCRRVNFSEVARGIVSEDIQRYDVDFDLLIP